VNLFRASSVSPNDQKADDKTQGRDTGQDVKNCRMVSINHAATGGKGEPRRILPECGRGSEADRARTGG
jgi:hypothetical protein